jgi:hypothetical protein
MLSIRHMASLLFPVAIPRATVETASSDSSLLTSLIVTPLLACSCWAAKMITSAAVRCSAMATGSASRNPRPDAAAPPYSASKASNKFAAIQNNTSACQHYTLVESSSAVRRACQGA